MKPIQKIRRKIFTVNIRFFCNCIKLKWAFQHSYLYISKHILLYFTSKGNILEAILRVHNLGQCKYGTEAIQKSHCAGLIIFVFLSIKLGNRALVQAYNKKTCAMSISVKHSHGCLSFLSFRQQGATLRLRLLHCIFTES